MRSLISLLSLSLFAPVALADDSVPAAPAAEAPPAPAPAPAVKAAPAAPSVVATSAIPEKCRVHARFVNGAVRPIAMSSRLALAQCLVAPSLEPVTSLLDSQESMLTLEKAVGQSLALYDDVIAFGEPAKQVVAAHAKGELYEELLARMANTVPPATNASGAALYETRKQLLDVLLDPWRVEAATAFQRAVALAKSNPAAAKDPSTRAAVAKSQQRLQRVAAAPPVAAAPAVATDVHGASATPTPSTPTAAATP